MRAVRAGRRAGPALTAGAARPLLGPTPPFDPTLLALPPTGAGHVAATPRLQMQAGASRAALAARADPSTNARPRVRRGRCVPAARHGQRAGVVKHGPRQNQAQAGGPGPTLRKYAVIPTARWPPDARTPRAQRRFAFQVERVWDSVHASRTAYVHAAHAWPIITRIHTVDCARGGEGRTGQAPGCAL